MACRSVPDPAVLALLVSVLLFSLRVVASATRGRTDEPVRRGHPRGAKPEKLKPLLPRRGLIRHVHLPPAEHSEHEGPGGRDRRRAITQYGYSVPRCHG